MRRKNWKKFWDFKVLRRNVISKLYKSMSVFINLAFGDWPARDRARTGGALTARYSVVPS